MPWAKGVVEDVITHVAPLFDARVGIKLPMHAHKDAQCAIVKAATITVQNIFGRRLLSFKK